MSGRLLCSINLDGKITVLSVTKTIAVAYPHVGGGENM